MVILIAGASHVGKTLLAQRMLERYGVPYLSIDAFAKCNEKVTIIESDFESTIEAVLDAVHPRWSSLQSA